MNRRKMRAVLLSEEAAASRIGIEVKSLRDYVNKGRISAACRLERELNGCMTVSYEFTPESVEDYLKKREEGHARKGQAYTAPFGARNPRREANLRKVRDRLDGTNDSLRKIGNDLNVSHTTIWWVVHRLLGYDYKSRRLRIRNGNLRQRGRSRRVALDESMHSLPAWCLLLQTECQKRKILFEPCLLWTTRGWKVNPRRLILNGRLVRISITRQGKSRTGHAVLEVPEKIRDDHFLLVIAFVKSGIIRFLFPGRAINKLRCLSLPLRRKVRRPYGHRGWATSRSRWWKYEDAWSLLSAG